MRKVQLEARFVALLKSTQPRPEFMKLFREIVLDVWRMRRQDAAKLEAAFLARLAELKRRGAVAESAFLYESKIDASIRRLRRPLVVMTVLYLAAMLVLLVNVHA